MTKYSEDDYCDLYGRKICDNCGKCLEEEGIDIKAIKIEDIAKDIEENKILEEEYKARMQLLKEEEDFDNDIDDEYEEENLEESSIDISVPEDLKAAYEKFKNETGIDLSNYDDEYEDAFDHLVSLEEADLLEEGSIEELTEEVFPGVRRIKKIK